MSKRHNINSFNNKKHDELPKEVEPPNVSDAVNVGNVSDSVPNEENSQESGASDDNNLSNAVAVTSRLTEPGDDVLLVDPIQG